MALAAAQAPTSCVSHRLGGVLWRPVDTGRQSGALGCDFYTAWRCRLRRPALASFSARSWRRTVFGARGHFLHRGGAVMPHRGCTLATVIGAALIKQPLITSSGC